MWHHWLELNTKCLPVLVEWDAPVFYIYFSAFSFFFNIFKRKTSFIFRSFQLMWPSDSQIKPTRLPALVECETVAEYQGQRWNKMRSGRFFFFHSALKEKSQDVENKLDISRLRPTCWDDINSVSCRWGGETVLQI